MTFLEKIGLAGSPQIQPSTVPPEPNGKKKQGTPEYKNGMMYIYCRPEDKERAKHLAKELNISMAVLIHRLLFAAEIAIPSKSKVSVLDGAAFWEMFELPEAKSDD